MLWTTWLIAAVALLVVEIITPGIFFFACLSIGALGAGIISLFVHVMWVQWIVFIIISVVSIYFVRPVATKLFVPKAKKFNVDALVGEKAWVTEKITPPHMGMVKVNGNLWRAEADTEIDIDRWVEITAVDGAHLQVKPK